eukprot:TRINITY_DN34982_c0_g2_i1.p1 TRINITY_DN34982_c0_g2~~TRINITY_DN34982_c0_g2_i1.p1  ORF type:complete len:385 (+),score=32.88 TRINITY_DN34982_c0_g2_i1:109-1155(+)
MVSRLLMKRSFYIVVAALILGSAVSLDSSSQKRSLRGDSLQEAADAWRVALTMAEPSRPNLLCALSEGTNYSVSIWQNPVARLEKRWRTCAVVSSSGVLTRHHHGADIDKADLVMRFNAAPLEGYNATVGARDDIRFVNNQFMSRSLMADGQNPSDSSARSQQVVDRHSDWYKVRPDTTYVAIPMDPIPAAETFVSKHGNIDVYVTNESMHESISDVFRTLYDPVSFRSSSSYLGCMSRLPTTGAVGMLAALAICDEVKAYGMASSAPTADSPHHYYDDSDVLDGTSMELPGNKRGSAALHNYHCSFAAEKDLWRRLASNSPEDIDKTDVATIPGFSRVRCGDKPTWQ